MDFNKEKEKEHSSLVNGRSTACSTAGGMSDIEESLKRITSHNGVMGVAVLDDAGKLARCAARRPLAACGARASC